MTAPLLHIDPIYDLQGSRIYRIRRYRKTGRARTIRSNVTLTEAHNHCSNPKTKGKDWFDGYDYMPGCAPKMNPNATFGDYMEDGDGG